VGAQEVRVSIYLAGPVLVLALLLTMSGIYGLLSQSVTERTHEVAVRMAVGASRTAVIALIVGQGLKLAGTGAITGAIGALMLDRLLGTFLFGLPAERPVALAFAAVLMILATILASIVPCLRAVHIDPGKTLKYE
jgi:putative ABC transport system permease protein